MNLARVPWIASEVQAFAVVQDIPYPGFDLRAALILAGMW
jgi:hypothetical protein